MTRKAAIKILMDGELNPCVAEDREACDMAIKALEQEPTTKNDLGVDCIDRKKLIDWINIWDITPIIKNPLIRHIQGMSSATPQEPTKNDLAVDCVARQDVERYIEGFINEYTPKEELEFINLELDGLKHIPTVTPQEPILDKITKIIEPLRHVPIGEMSDIEWDILRVIDKYKAEVRDNNG